MQDAIRWVRSVLCPFLVRTFTYMFSLKVAVAGLFLLMLLVFFGTLYQVEHGLHAAQQKYFFSWVFLQWGFLPFPGGKLVLFILFANLFASMMVHFQYGWRLLGIVAVHFGILLMLAGGWFTHLFGEESFLVLREGEGANLTTAYKEWELSIWEPGESPMIRDITALDADGLDSGDRLRVEDYGLILRVDRYHTNARAFQDRSETGDSDILNVNGINVLHPEPSPKDPESNMPGGLFDVGFEEGEMEEKLLLFGGDQRPTRLTQSDGSPLLIQLRRKRYPLPMIVELLDFDKEFYPASSIPKAFSSRIKVYLQDLEREALIEMNQPFRYRGYTFFQASYMDVKPGDPEISRFAVTRNYGRLIPYVATGVTVAGLVLHFLIVLIPRKRKQV